MPDLRKNTREFSKILMDWNRRKNDRQMPWKGEKDPYKIWLSEIILQQTRVEQGLRYYDRFVGAYPDVHKLAKASEEKVLKLWEGLGYYARCRNLMRSARYISSDLNGRFPDSFDGIKALKGVGPYTAAAISSFAFDLPHAVVDGNVFRVLSRVFGISDPVDSTAGKKKFHALANDLLDKKQPGLYNQAIMDFGAIVCKPVPSCAHCFFKTSCYAFSENKIDELPVKEKKTSIRKRWFYYLVMEHKGKIAIRQRNARDIWQQLYEFPMIEAPGNRNWKTILSMAEVKGLLPKKGYKIVSRSRRYRQQLSHQLIAGQFIELKLGSKNFHRNGWIWQERRKLKMHPFPGLINEYRSAAFPEEN